MTLAIKKANTRYTYGDYLQWNDEERWELIDGVAYNMTAAPNRRHQEVSQALSRRIGNYLAGKPCKVYAAPFDVRLPFGAETDEQVTTVVQPDIVVICDKSKLDDHGCKGVPDWIIEILSPSTAKKDMILKLRLYERAGVREYWMVDPADQTVLLFCLGEDGKYGNYETYDVSQVVKVGIFPDLELALAEVFAED